VYVRRGSWADNTPEGAAHQGQPWAHRNRMVRRAGSAARVTGPGTPDRRRVDDLNHLPAAIAATIVIVVDPTVSLDATLAIETENAVRLVGYALNMLNNSLSGPVDADPFFACLSLGMEKTLKLSIGLDGVARHGGWPSKKIMQNEYSHRIDKMDSYARQVIRDHLDEAAAPPYVREALDECGSDPLVDKIIDAMSRYAMDGRFHNLDHLATRVPGESTPLSLWLEIQRVVMSSSAAMAEIQAEIDGPFRWPRTVINAVDKSVRAWVEMYRRAWVHGLFGPDGRQVSGGFRLLARP
jgi:hypothetical protein